jgi:hypothetical protein
MAPGDFGTGENAGLETQKIGEDDCVLHSGRLLKAGTDRSVHTAPTYIVLKGIWFAPWDRVVSPLFQRVTLHQRANGIGELGEIGAGGLQPEFGELLRCGTTGDGITVKRSNRGADNEVGVHAIGKGSPGACLPGSEESAAGEYERTFHDGFIFAYVERVGWRLRWQGMALPHAAEQEWQATRSPAPQAGRAAIGRAWPCPTQLQ